MTRRDSYRSLVYAAEEETGGGRRFHSVAGMQRYVDSLQRSTWFRRRWPRAVPIEIAAAREGQHRAWGGPWRVTLPRHMWCELVLLHEVAHCLQGPGTISHGPAFLRILLALVGQNMQTRTAQRLRRALEARRVAIPQIHSL